MTDETPAAAPAATTETPIATTPAAQPAATAAPAPPPVPVPPSPPPPAAPFQWPDELKGAAASHGWDKFSAEDALTMVAKSYTNAEKLIGAPPDKVLRLPDPGAPPEAWEKVYAALGRPEKPEDYKIEKPAGLPENFPYDEAIIKNALPELHKMGLDNTRVQGLWGLIQQANVTAMQAHEAEMARRAQEGDAELRRQFGGEYDTNLALRDRVVQRYGGEEFASYMKQYGFDRDPSFVRMLVAFGKATAEDGATVSVAAAAASSQSEVDRLITDRDFQARIKGEQGLEAKQAAQSQWVAALGKLADATVHQAQNQRW